MKRRIKSYIIFIVYLTECTSLTGWLLCSFICVFLFRNDLFRTFRCAGIGKVPHLAAVLSGKVDNDVVRFMPDAVGLNPDYICSLDDFRAGNIITHKSYIR